MKDVSDEKFLELIVNTKVDPEPRTPPPPVRSIRGEILRGGELALARWKIRKAWGG